ncbi:endo alpha-1,4 polygalactosaminidase (plasmid) [Cereibacter azotoformans]|uniref:MJ1477/TM1410 family putative glycoside hydrolase n=1 Tax=Cereibacter azotoformans TaxID=43057 RepID=UPI000E359911|nr:MJ1477/TM1410 family putative glycoside hydrolase [Cereibacter azotoformans]AXQ96004.1 sulfate ABC transporter, periplasmic sulfate-binding protein [Cereibacter sphaeroides]UIJ33072.1 endo alpha-1,4 polygalactosaminidase [Cereibacter azotoformans]
MSRLSSVKSWLYHLGDIDARRAQAIGASNADLVVTEWASYRDGEAPYGRALLDRMRGGDPDRLIVSYLSIAEAEDYRYYWQDSWAKTPPHWLGAENPEWAGNMKVRYWEAGWQKIVLGYLDRIIDRGFNGVYLDIIDAFEFWEETAPRSGIDYRQEMADFVLRLRTHALERLAKVDPDRDFVILGQNGLDLIGNATYRTAVDGVAAEDVRFHYPNGRPKSFTPQDDGEAAWALQQLLRAERAGIETFVVEYVPPAARAAAAGPLAGLASEMTTMGSRLFVAANRDLDGLPAQPRAAFGGLFPTFGPEAPDPRPLSGTSRPDRLTGGAGSERISGGAGNDRLDGRGGRDVLQGGTGDDLLRGGPGDDGLLGDAGRDRLEGGVGHDRLYGRAGNDVLLGGAGDDVLHGQAGADRLHGGAGADVFVYRRGDGGDLILDFNRAHDLIDLPLHLDHRMRAVQGDTLIDFGGGDRLTVRGILPDAIDDFLI